MAEPTTSIECPRCGQAAEVRFYGPCAGCRDQLRSTLGSEPVAHPADVARYEPKMNVTVNAVALKDD